VILVLFLMSLLGVAAFAIDYGLWSVNRSQVQSAADAAALAGAAGIPGGWGTATGYASSEYTKNGKPADTYAASATTDLAPNDSVTVNASRSVGTGLAGIFGIHSVTVSASARATIQSFSQLNGLNVMPWGVLQGSYTPGQPYPIYTKSGDPANANNGAISLPYVDNTNCPDPNGANIYSDEIAGTTQVCPVSVGETVETKPGDNSGKTSQGLNLRITNWQTLNQIVQFQPDGTAILLDPQSPQLVLIPVLTNGSGQSAWPSGTSAPMTVVGFAWFVITSCGDPAHPTYCANNDGKEVNGVFVTLEASATIGTPGPYNPQSNTAYTVTLTK
jgi:Putative Flp pilus-assembly TadE/G-like